MSLRILAAILLPAFSWAATVVSDLFPSDRLTVTDRPTLPLDPHPFLVLFVKLGASGVQLASTAAFVISLDAQNQVANFFAADGATIPHSNVLSTFLGIPVFERPASLPMDLGFQP